MQLERQFLKDRKKSKRAKIAHKRHHASYRLGTNKMERTKMNNRDKENSIQDVIAGLQEALNEATEAKDNTFELSGKINFENIPGGIQLDVSPEDKNVSLSFTLGAETGNGNYRLQEEGTNDNDYKELYNVLMDDLKTLSQTIDKEIKQILDKNGLLSTK